VPQGGAYREVLSSDDRDFGGSLVDTPNRIEAEPVPWHGQPHSVRLTLPPLGALVLKEPVPTELSNLKNHRNRGTA
jgi:1,4-alpha-glucan branching enzyme